MQTRETFNKYPPISDDEIRNALNKAVKLVTIHSEEFSDCFPAASSEGNFYPRTANNDWTEGFWTGELWLVYEHSKNDKLRDTALKQVESFLYRIKNHINTDHHDMGFLYTPSCVAAYKLVKNEEGKEAALLAADNLTLRFQENGGFFQAWGKMGDKNNYRLIIDCLMNMPLLFWASEVTGKPLYREKAEIHITTAMKNIIRPDNSTYHTYYFDTATGLPLKGVTCQGNRDGSAWARGQAWGIYGSAIAYSKLKKEEYKDIFRCITDYFIEHLPSDLIPYWDFDFDTGSNEPRDSSAGAIAVCGMLEMSKYLEETEAQYYTDAAKRILKALVSHCAVKSCTESDGLLLHGTYAKKTPTNTCNNAGVDECCIWGDYFYLEALTRLSGDWDLYW